MIYLMFQSSLPVTGERVLALPFQHAIGVDVSILAPRHRGACPKKNRFCVDKLVVSILAPRHRGACPTATFWRTRAVRVSILAPRHRGACRQHLPAPRD